MSTRSNKTLRLERETLRVLASPQLARVLGGFLEDPYEHAQPKSNAWSAGSETLEEGDVICGELR